MSFTVQRLDSTERLLLLAHLLSLPPADRQLRFGTVLAPALIARYVAKLDFVRDAVFGVRNDDLSLAGLAHVAFEGGRAEVGLSVLPAHRRRGVGAALLARAAEHARNRGAPAIFMQFLSHNTVVARMARRLGMDLSGGGVETQARLELPDPSAGSILAELATNAFAACAVALKAFLAGWNHRAGAMARGAGSTHRT